MPLLTRLDFSDARGSAFPAFRDWSLNAISSIPQQPLPALVSLYVGDVDMDGLHNVVEMYYPYRLHLFEPDESDEYRTLIRDLVPYCVVTRRSIIPMPLLW
jgi:hypothetical protein